MSQIAHTAERRAARAVGHGVEAHQHVREARRAEQPRQPEREEVELRQARLPVLQAGLQQRRTGSRVSLHRGAQQRGEVEPPPAQHPHRERRARDDQQRRLEDLHPRGALHAADQHVDEHEHTHAADDDRLAEPVGVSDAHQQGDEPAGPGDLGHQVEHGHEQRRRGGGRPHRAHPQPVAQHVGHRVAAGVAQRLGDEQQRDHPAGQRADREHDAVVAVDRHRADDAQERRGGQVVPRDRDAVLRAGETLAAGVVVGGGPPAARGGDHDGEGRQDEPGEDRQVEAGVPDGGTRGEQ